MKDNLKAEIFFCTDFLPQCAVIRLKMGNIRITLTRCTCDRLSVYEHMVLVGCQDEVAQKTKETLSRTPVCSSYGPTSCQRRLGLQAVSRKNDEIFLHNHTADGRNPTPPGMHNNYPVNNGIMISYISTGAGFLPSTVSSFKLT